MSNDIMKQDNIKETRIIHSLITFMCTTEGAGKLVAGCGTL